MARGLAKLGGFGWLALLVLVGLLLFVRGAAALGVSEPISIYVVASGSMEPTLHGGPYWSFPDLIIISGKQLAPFSSVKVGDIIVFRKPCVLPGGQCPEEVIVHRVVGIEGGGLRTKGDNNAAPDPWVVTSSDYIGLVRLNIKNLGFFTFYSYPRAALLPNLGYLLIIIYLLLGGFGRSKQARG
ncbi:MAG: signal peptidase I [Nitrososphaerota archaeon]